MRGFDVLGRLVFVLEHQLPLADVGRDRMGPDDILACLEVECPAYSKTELRDFLARFLRLWSMNQWKRY